MSNLLLSSWLRRSLSWLPAVLLALPALAQVDTYQFTPSVGTFVPLPATATTVPNILADDQVSGVLPLGFSFVYDGTAFTSFLVSSNGFISFNPASGNALTNSLGTNASGTEKPLIAPFWEDLDGREPTARASYQTTGTAPNQVFTFEWLNWKRFGNGTGPSFSLQAKLYEGSGRVEFVYRRETGALSGTNASIGLAGAVVGTTPSDFLSLSDAGAAPTASGTVETNSIATSPATGQVYSFLPPAPSACPTPRGLTGVATAATSATLSWSVAAGTGPYTVQYGPAGFSPALPSSGTNAYTTLTGVTGTSVAVTGLTGGGTYQFFVTQVCGGAAGSSPISNAGSFILNNEPCGAGLLTIANTCTPTNGTTQGATTTPANGYSNPSTVCTNFNSTPLDVWYSFTTAASGPTSTGVRIRVSGAAEVVRGFSGATCAGPFTELGCANSSFGTPATPDLDLTNLLPSTTYYVAVSNASSFSPVTGPFTICATPVPNCPAPAGFTTGTLTNTTAQISWSGSTGGTYTVTYGPGGFTPPVGGTTLTGLTTPSTTLTNLQPNTAYDVYIQQICGGFNGSSTVAGPFGFSTPLTVPTNDDPCGAVTLGSAVVSSTNVGSTTSLQNGINLPACSPANAPKDVWFSFTAAQTTSTLSLSGTAAGMVRVFTTPDCANGPFTQVDCLSSGANNTGVASLALTGLTIGQRYYVAVSGYGSSNATGPFTIGATNTVLTARTQADTNALLVYPNPSNTGRLTLRLAPATGLRQAVLLNALGQTVLRETLPGTASEHSVSTRALPTGIYTLRVSQGGQVFTRKVVLD